MYYMLVFTVLYYMFLFNLAVDDIIEQCSAGVILAPNTRPLVDLDYADDVVIFASNSAKLQHVINVASKLAAAYRLKLRPETRQS
ncbi:hypothetical protein RB195_006351 [Necator americanus]|uniref:Reverse transcriptase domain-containing protein n=1 Tax=Necator americanus TaxID=51031 RepID=A0ABR1BW18_NECAM